MNPVIERDVHEELYIYVFLFINEVQESLNNFFCPPSEKGWGGVVEEKKGCVWALVSRNRTHYCVPRAPISYTAALDEKMVVGI